MSMSRTFLLGSANSPSPSKSSLKNWSLYSAIPALTKTASIFPNLSAVAWNPERWSFQDVTLHLWKRRRDWGIFKDGGGGARSRIAILLVAEILASSIAVARPMPEEPPVMRMVLLRRFVSDLGSTLKVGDILKSGVSMRRGVYHHKDICK
jgi:hypothetical protein